MIPENAGFDSPGILDWDYEDLFGKEGGASITGMDRKEVAELITFFNQYKDRQTMNACGWYGLTHAENTCRIMQDADWGYNQQIDPAKRWIPRQEKRPPTLRYKGTQIQSNLEYFRREGWIAGNARCDGVEKSIQAIADGNMIYTGSNDCDWKKTYQTGVYHRAGRQTQGHLFFAFGRDHERGGFMLGDSNGPKHGPIFIKDEDWNSLYSKNAILLDNNLDLILKYRTMSQFDKEYENAIEQGITNGERPQDPAIRKESAVMDVRTLAKANKYTDERFVVLEQKIDGLLKAVEALGKMIKPSV